MAVRPPAPSAVLAVLGGKAFDSYLAERAVLAHIEAWVGSERGEAVNVLHGDESSWAAVLNAARTGSLFAQRRVIVVRQAERLRGVGRAAEGSADDEAGDASGLQREISQMIDDPTPGVSLVLVAAKVDRRRKPWKLLVERASVTTAEPLKGRALRAFLEGELRGRSLRLPSEVVDALVERTGQDLRRLMGEVDKLELLAGSSREVTVAEAEAVLGRSLARPLWELADAFAGQDVGRALQLAEGLLEDREPALLILETLNRTLRQLRAARSLGSERVPRAEWAGRLGLPPPLAFKAQGLVESAGAWAPGGLERALGALQRGDRRIKRGVDGRVVLSCVLAEASGREEGAVRPSPRMRGR